LIRGQRVLLDADLAALYGLTIKAFNQAGRRNIDRFASTSCCSCLMPKRDH